MRAAIAISLGVHLVCVVILLHLQASHAAEGQFREVLVNVELVERASPPSVLPPGEDVVAAQVPTRPAGTARRPARLGRASRSLAHTVPAPELSQTSAENAPEESADGRQALGRIESPASVSAEPQAAAADGRGRAAEPAPSASPSALFHPAGGPSWQKIADAVRRQVVYPMLARRRDMHGRAVVSFMLDTSGTATDLRIVESSGHAMLDAAALDAVARAVPLPSPGAPTHVVLPIVFALQ